MTGRNSYKMGHLTAQPGDYISSNDTRKGIQSLDLGTNKPALVYVPKFYNNKNASALAVMLHGAGGDANHGISLLRDYADEFNIIVLAPSSREVTWDIIANNAFDADVILIDQALSKVFQNYSIDPAHIAIGGFSDGASYALCLGLSNGQLFTHIIAFSPGFSYARENRGKPRIFISHGVNDRVLPIKPCSRVIVSKLNQSGYDLTYDEFTGEHEIPFSTSKAAVNWFLS